MKGHIPSFKLAGHKLVRFAAVVLDQESATLKPRKNANNKNKQLFY